MAAAQKGSKSNRYTRLLLKYNRPFSGVEMTRFF